MECLAQWVEGGCGREYELVSCAPGIGCEFRGTLGLSQEGTYAGQVRTARRHRESLACLRSIIG